MADLGRKNIQFLVTLVDTLDVDMKGHHVGLITTKNVTAYDDIKVKFSDEASQNETALLDKIRVAAKTAGFTPPDENYQAALTNVQEIFTPENGGRKDAKKVLLLITDNTEVFTQHPGTADAVNAMKVQQQGGKGREGKEQLAHFWRILKPHKNILKIFKAICTKN